MRGGGGGALLPQSYFFTSTAEFSDRCWEKKTRLAAFQKNAPRIPPILLLFIASVTLR